MLEDYFYHIYNRGNNKENIFKEEKNYFYFLKKFNIYLGNILDVYAYCLMPNHFHFLVKLKTKLRETSEVCTKLKETSEVSKTSEVYENEKVCTKAFKDFFISYSKSINKMYARTGSLFQPKFKKKIIIKPNHLLAIIPYIHNNPVRAGLVKVNEHWLFSSYQSYLNDKINFEISGFVFSLYGSKDKFIKFHNEYSDYQKERDYLFK